MRRLQHRLPETRQGWVLATFLAAALVFGGGGSPSAAAEIVVELGFAASLVAWLWWARADAVAGRQPHAALIGLAAVIVGAPLIQLVPLPPAMWQALPGRESMVAALAAVDTADRWRPLSVAPFLTLAGLLSMIPAAAVLLATGVLAGRDRRFLLLVIALMALAAAGLGVLQMAGNGHRFRLYQISHDLWLTGFHASRNSAADALLVGMLALTAWFATGSRRRPLFRGDLGLLALAQGFLFVALLLTGSRAGIALLVPVLLLQFAMLRSAGLGRTYAKGLAGFAGAFALVIAASVAFSGNNRLAGVLARFDATRDSRTDLWQDTLTAIGQYWPVGSGIGTFPRGFLPVERLSTVDDLFPNRAHNDVLEFLLETGLLAPLVLATGLLIVVLLARKAWAVAPRERPVTLFAIGTLVVIALHSLVDYPLRNMALACVTAVAVGLIGAIARHSEAERGTGVE
jgi:O-antigen ligase